MPARATDDHGHDVTDRIARIDRRYPDDFQLDVTRGHAAELHFDLRPGLIGGLIDRAVCLLLTAWTDYAFSSDNLAAHQAGLALASPSLEIKDASGAWRTAIADIGIPVGRPQTIVVDLTGRIRKSEHEVRIVTNMRIYWDQVLVATAASRCGLKPAALDPVRADLTERGFSAEVRPDGREPVTPDYERVRSPWKMMPGRYTRNGDVRELLAVADDVFVVAKPGDAIALSFDARALPPVPKGWTRTFLLHGDGFSKEMDINSASPDAVVPLPFHGLTHYPYEPSEAPVRLRKQAARAEAFNTRVVARPLVPLELAASAHAAGPGGRD